MENSGMELGGAMKDFPKIESLSADERLELLERLWDSLSATPSDVPVTEAQLTELDRRALALDRDLKNGKALGVPWDEVVRQLRARR
jgi:putative addiction module component (TIGR02574 family)